MKLIMTLVSLQCSRDGAFWIQNETFLDMAESADAHRAKCIDISLAKHPGYAVGSAKSTDITDFARQFVRTHG